MPIDLSTWLNQVSTDENPPDSVIAFNIGMFETPDGYAIYLGGFGRFDKNDPDWAIDPIFVPSEKYFYIRRSGSDWEEVLSEVISSVRSFVTSEAGRKSYLAQAKHLTVGFDDGDLYEIY